MMARVTCEEWMEQLRHSLSGERSRRFVGDQVTDRKGVESTNGAPPLMTVEEFHNECLRIVAKLKASSSQSLG